MVISIFTLTLPATLNQFVANNSDLDFEDANIFVVPSFYRYFTAVLVPIARSGFNALLSSRLIPETGGQVSNTCHTNNSINPGWRTALLHMVYSQGWFDLISEADRKYLATQISHRGESLDKLSTGSQLSCYTNEADPNEMNWQLKFFGSEIIYNQLKSIKNTVDPDGLFVCKNCIGSDDWTENLNCPKT